MVDYASAGQTWDETSMTTVWLPTKNYWNVDLSAPVKLTSPNFWNSSDFVYSMIITDEGKLGISTEKFDTFILEAEGEGRFKIRTESNRYLALSEDQKYIICSESPEIFKIVRYAQNRYKIFASNGRVLIGSNDPIKTPFITVNVTSWHPSTTLKITNV